MLSVAITSAKSVQVIVKVSPQAFLFMFYYFILIFFISFPFNETKTVLTIFLAFAIQIDSRNWLKF